jgi:pimeloyl-ACP methyl ester carboxylesterase
MNEPALPVSGYASVNGLNMYYEIHGAGDPLVLLHGGIITIDSSFAAVLPAFAKNRRVIAVEQQAHGHTADIDRPLTFEQMADDTAALLRHLNIENADFFGFSDGGNVALGIAIRHPKLVRKLVIAGTNYNNDGLHSEVLTSMAQMKPHDLDGTPLQEVYARVALNPDDWHTLVAKVMTQAMEFRGWPPEEIQSIKAPTLIIIGDADIIRPEHAVEVFRLHGGGAPGDIAGLPNSRLAVLPGTSHFMLMNRADWLIPMITEFLDAPMPDAK